MTCKKILKNRRKLLKKQNRKNHPEMLRKQNRKNHQRMLKEQIFPLSLKRDLKQKVIRSRIIQRKKFQKNRHFSSVLFTQIRIMEAS